MHTGTLLASLVLLSSAALAPHRPVEDTLLKERDHKSIGGKVSDYWVAKDKKEDITATFEKLSDAVDKAATALAKKDGPEILAAVDDWREIFWFATLDGLNDKKLKKGKVTLAEPDNYAAFTYCLDKKYAAKKGPFPLIIVVPDKGQSPEDALEAAWEDEDLRSDAILVAVHMEGDAAEWSSEAGATNVMRTYGSIARGLTGFAFDCDRVYLAGQGQGFAAAAATAASFPHLFAGLIGRGDIPDIDVRNFRNLPTYLSGGGSSAEIAKAIEALEFGNCKADGADSSADVWAWTQENTRVAYPVRITFEPFGRRALSTNWITVGGGIEEDAKLDATADRASNTLTISTSGIAQVTLLLNDSIMDLNKPVKLNLNGNEHEVLLKRNRRHMIDQVYGLGDWGRIFTATETFDASSE